MDDAIIERRRAQRSQPQQQPEQSAFDPLCAAMARKRAIQESPRKAQQSLANAQAKKQTGKL
jgi:hypothetical protein